jgi:hypothetical protein
MAVLFDHSPVEPAHPMVVKLYEELLALYKVLRQRQSVIDGAFDSSSRQIGYVVTTTIPAVLEVGAKGRITLVKLGSENLKDTIFEREFERPLKELCQPVADVAAGTYKLYLIWYEALKLRLRTDWIEPAHFRRPTLRETILRERTIPVRPEVQEPAHWFDPGTAIAVEESVLISVIDEVYPELRLADRIASSRWGFARRVRPEVTEPAHFRQERLREPEKATEVLAEIASVLRRFGY